MDFYFRLLTGLSLAAWPAVRIKVVIYPYEPYVPMVHSDIERIFFFFSDMLCDAALFIEVPSSVQ